MYSNKPPIKDDETTAQTSENSAKRDDLYYHYSHPKAPLNKYQFISPKLAVPRPNTEQQPVAIKTIKTLRPK